MDDVPRVSKRKAPERRSLRELLRKVRKVVMSTTKKPQTYLTLRGFTAQGSLREISHEWRPATIGIKGARDKRGPVPGGEHEKNVANMGPNAKKKSTSREKIITFRSTNSDRGKVLSQRKNFLHCDSTKRGEEISSGRSRPGKKTRLSKSGGSVLEEGDKD